METEISRGPWGKNSSLVFVAVCFGYAWANGYISPLLARWMSEAAADGLSFGLVTLLLYPLFHSRRTRTPRTFVGWLLLSAGAVAFGFLISFASDVALREPYVPAPFTPGIDLLVVPVPVEHRP